MMYSLKLIVCGSGGVGKTSIVRRYVENKFSAGYLLTLGMEPSNRTINIKIDNKTYSINQQIWDVAGQKRFQFVRKLYFSGASGALLVFDLTKPNTLTELREWRAEILDRVGPIPMLLIGNKSDLKNHISINNNDLENIFIPEYGVQKYVMTSALLDKGISEAFNFLTSHILKIKNIIEP
ncbi:MAG: Rab family GTPase [Candidatus Hodarchaeales archaeon]